MREIVNALAVEAPHGVLREFQYVPQALLPSEVEIRVEYCGICHSDLSMIDNHWGLSRYPLVPGHEVAGIISEVGSEVKNLSLGDRVGLGWHCGYCNSCEACRNGDENLCDTPSGTIVEHHGAFAERVRASADSVVLIPNGVEMDVVGPLMCGGVTVFNPIIQFDIRPKHKVGVVGIGGLGHMAIQFLRAWGCEVVAFTSSKSKVEEIRSMGADDVVEVSDVDRLRSLKRQLDFIISTVNVNMDWNLYLAMLKARGRLHFVGVPLEPLSVSVPNLIGKQRSISGSTVGSPETMRKMFDFVAKHRIRPIVEEFPMTEAEAALQHLRDRKARYRVVLKQNLCDG